MIDILANNTSISSAVNDVSTNQNFVSEIKPGHREVDNLTTIKSFTISELITSPVENNTDICMLNQEEEDLVSDCDSSLRSEEHFLGPVACSESVSNVDSAVSDERTADRIVPEPMGSEELHQPMGSEEFHQPRTIIATVINTSAKTSVELSNIDATVESSNIDSMVDTSDQAR